MNKTLVKLHHYFIPNKKKRPKFGNKYIGYKLQTSYEIKRNTTVEHHIAIRKINKIYVNYSIGRYICINDAHFYDTKKISKYCSVANTTRIYVYSCVINFLNTHTINFESKWYNHDSKDIRHLDFTNVESYIKELEKMKNKNY